MRLNNYHHKMKQIFLTIQNKLSEITSLRYIDKDWGQLQYEQPPVQWPCALIDVTNVDYVQQGRGAQLGNALICVTVGNINPVPSSAAAPNRANSYATIELLDEIHQKLQLLSDGSTFQPLMRTNLLKAAANGSYEVYQMTYKTAFVVRKEESGKTEVTVTPKVVRG